MAPAVKSAERASYRTVVLLRRSEKLKLERLASREKVSSAEVLRRLIRRESATASPEGEEEAIVAALKIISTAVTEANDSLNRTIARLDTLHVELQKRARR